MRYRASSRLDFRLAAIATFGISISFTVAATTVAFDEFKDAISREVSVYRPWQLSTTTDAISREVSVYREIPCEPPDCYTNAHSREMSVFREFPFPQIADAVSREVSALSVFPLTLGTPYDGALPAGAFLYFRVTTPPGVTIRVTLHHDSPTAITELLASFGSPPNSLTAQFAGEAIGTGTRELVIPSTQNGSYFILAQSTNDPGPNASTAFDLVATTAVFGIDRVTPSAVGAGVATITIKGADFDAITDFAIGSLLTGALITPAQTTLVDAATARVTFDFTDVDLGSYEVAAQKSGVTVIHAAPIKIEAPSTQQDIVLSHNFPSAVRGGRPFQGLVGIENIGNLDIDVVIIEVLVSNDPLISIWPTDLTESDTTPQDFGVNKGFLLATIALAPGERRFIPVTLLAATTVPAHTLLPLELVVRGISKAAYRDGILFRDSERARQAVLHDQDLPAALRTLAEDQDEWWAIVRSHFETNGFPPVTGTSRTAAASVGLNALLCGLNCLLVSVPVGAATGGVGGAIVQTVCTSGCANWCSSNEPRCRRDLPCVGATVACGVMAGIAGSYGCNRVCLDIIQSGDPNEKRGPSGFGGSGFLRATGAVSYRILFENVPTATAPAAEIRIVDDLDPSLDLATVAFSRIGFGNKMVDVPTNRDWFHILLDIRIPGGDDQLQVLVDLKGGIDITARRVWWNLTALDPSTMQLPTDPTKGLLPPNLTPPEGEGFVEFTVTPLPDLTTGALLHNKASIFFDYNDPIETNEVSNRVDSGAPLTSVEPLSEQSLTPFVLRWNGLDDDGGAGLSQYRIYARSNDGPAELVYSGADTWAHFNGDVGNKYAFFSSGIDNVGNIEDFGGPETTTTVTALRRPGDIDLDGDTDLDDLVALLSCWQTPLGPGADVPTRCAETDLSGDRSVDLVDFGILQSDIYGQ